MIQRLKVTNINRGGKVMTKRGDVVIIDFPFASGGAGKSRPAVVIQCDRLNAKIENTVVVMVTGNTGLVGKDPSQFLIDPATPEGKSSGLKIASAVRCQNIVTIGQNDIHVTIGHLSDALKVKLNDALKATLELP
jgi:mRNA interferase MazF